VPQGSQPKAATARKVDTKSYNSTALADQSFCAKKLDWGDPVTEVLTQGGGLRLTLKVLK
ncbi:hypothetical protein, partial [Yoonia sp. R2-816]|uniref:hypothetical protein n=1 Tax=Yoonia sp. R2-816 TaxID=3342638 RepID=UPI00372CB33E